MSWKGSVFPGGTPVGTPGGSLGSFGSIDLDDILCSEGPKSGLARVNIR
jgi:hypothetical protein